MSTEFENIGSCVGKNEDWIRAQAVEAALVLINTAISTSTGNVVLLKSLLSGDKISEVADGIEQALKSTK